jgi:hypothetical protein
VAQLSLLNDTALRPTRQAIAHRLAASFFAVLMLVHAAPARAAEQMYFPATDNVTNVLVQKINAETVRIDMSCWYLTEHAISIALINRFKAGVQVRLIGDRGSIFEIDPITKGEFYWLANQGVPIRLRFNPTWFPEIDHMKMTLFVGQNLVTFGSANYTPFELAPTSATNYKDESVLFSDDSALVDAFKTRFDQLWNDTRAEPNSIVPQPPYFKNFHDACVAEPTGNCSDFATRYPHPAPMIINTNRLEPDYPTPAGLIWGQGPQFNNRLVQEISNENTLVRFVIYRLTVDNITQALLNKWQSGVPVQLLIEPSEYMNRKWPEFWLTHANLDKLWAAGIPIKQRAHNGLTHMKTLVTSTYATVASSNYASGWQRDDNYFIPSASKPAIYQALKNRVTAMWNSPTAFTPFQPQPPDAPTLSSPASGATNVPTNAARPGTRARLPSAMTSTWGPRPPTSLWRRTSGSAREQSAVTIFLAGKSADRDDDLLEDRCSHERDGRESVARRELADPVLHDCGRCVRPATSGSGRRLRRDIRRLGIRRRYQLGAAPHGQSRRHGHRRYGRQRQGRCDPRFRIAGNMGATEQLIVVPASCPEPDDHGHGRPGRQRPGRGDSRLSGTRRLGAIQQRRVGAAA